MTGRTCGQYRRDNAGMSSESHARNMAVESPRFPGEGSSAQGKSGPKVRTEVVADGEQVEIPAPPRNEALTQKDRTSRVMVSPVPETRLYVSEVPHTGGWVNGRAKSSSETSDFTLARKGAGKSEGARTGNRRRWARRES